MSKLLLSFVLLAGAIFGQYKTEPSGAPPSELDPAVAATLQKVGIKVLGPSGSVYCEVWLRTKAPSGPKSSEEGVSFPTIPHGSLLGAIRFPATASDRRGQNLKAGVYTLRYSLHPVNGDHLGVAPQRDFLVLAPASDDKNPNSTPGFDEVVAMSKKVSGTPHPAVLSMSSTSADKANNSLTKEGDHDWVLSTKVGDLPMAVILVGKAEG